MKNLIFHMTLLISVLQLNSCSGGMIRIKSDQEIPEKFVQKADSFITAKTGDEFFRDYISFNSNKTTKIENGFLLVYDFKIPGKDYVDEQISFTIDSAGNTRNDGEVIGIPDCFSNNCDYKIDRVKAYFIASDYRLEEGTREWKYDFIWDSSRKRYVWTVQTTLSEGAGSQGFRGSGKTLIIDASSGNVLELKEWRVN